MLGRLAEASLTEEIGRIESWGSDVTWYNMFEQETFVVLGETIRIPGFAKQWVICSCMVPHGKVKGVLLAVDGLEVRILSWISLLQVWSVWQSKLYHCATRSLALLWSSGCWSSASILHFRDLRGPIEASVEGVWRSIKIRVLRRVLVGSRCRGRSLPRRPRPLMPRRRSGRKNCPRTWSQHSKTIVDTKTMISCVYIYIYIIYILYVYKTLYIYICIIF